jgi:beta-glucuronidase
VKPAKAVLTAVLVFIAAAAAALAWAYHVAVEGLKPRAQFSLYDKGTESIVDYGKYGVFENEGTADFKYRIKDRKGLAAAVGEGITPNSQVFKDPEYKKLVIEKALEGDRWNFVGISDNRLSFYKWASTTNEDPGVRGFYTALALENGGLITHAIKAYYAIIVNYPKTTSYTYWNTPWYPARSAILNIQYLTEKYPILGMKITGSDISVKNGFDIDAANDEFIVNPGRMVKCRPSDLLKRQDRSRLDGIMKEPVKGRNVRLVQYKSGDWQLIVNGKPFIVKAVAYAPTKIGESPDEGTLSDWSGADYNENGVIDAPYEAWVDSNGNGLRDAGEKAIGDFKLMKDMGVNAIRIYDWQQNRNKALFRELYKKYGIMVIMGDLMGTYSVGSGSSWYRGTNYAEPKHQANMKERVRKMIEEYKDEPYILMWMLGNETNYGVANSSKRYPRPFYGFANEVSKMIKAIDPNHPVMIGNGDTLYLNTFAELCPDVDILGMNSYRGWHGFGLWADVKRVSGKPALITEYGAAAKIEGRPALEGEDAQAEYHTGAWKDILYNSAGYGAGNALGGVVFEWTDEWWKAYEPALHDTHKQWPGPVKGGWFFEEWLGLTSQGPGTDSPYLRQLRKSYYAYKRMWNPSFYDKLKDMCYNILIKSAR